MRKELVYFSSGFGVMFIISSLLNISIQKNLDKIIIFWLWFGILAHVVHLLMHYNRMYRDTIRNSNLLIMCTISQIIVIFLYIKTRDNFKHFKFISDFAILQIVTIMIARAIALFNNTSLYFES